MTALVEGLLNGLGTGFAAGVAFGLTHQFGVRILSGGAELEPSRVRIQIFGRTRKLHRRFVPRFGVGFAAGLLFGLVLVPVGGLAGLLVGARFPPVTEVVGYGLGYGLAVGLAVGFMTWLEAPIDIRRVVSPTDLLRTNRAAVVFLVLTWVFMFGIVGSLIAGGLGRGPTTIGSDLLNGVVIGIVGGAGGGLSYGLSLTAWGQWVALTRIWLPLTGRLPWAVHTFLDDAYQRGVLRQAGAVYQFRHARLHNHLTHVFQAHRGQQPTHEMACCATSPTSTPEPFTTVQ
jgi:tetrahydromethanopterin S-methyltransferase subunit F